MLGYKISIRKFKKIEIIQSMICLGKPGHNRMKLEINSRKKMEYSQTCGNQTIYSWIIIESKKSKRKLENTSRHKKTTQIKSCRCSKSST